MSIDGELRIRIRTVFVRLNRIGAGDAFSAPASVRNALEDLIPAATIPSITVEPKIAILFATASVDMWLRAVHSLLVSASLTNASPIWASVSGYYASHYAVRGLAHLLGFFLLFSRKRIVQLTHYGGGYVCAFTKKAADDREHRLYWRRVKAEPYFAEDPFFTENIGAEDASDIRHRDHANYADSLFPYPNFRPLNEETLRSRLAAIAQIEITDPPIPRLTEFADLDNVQLVAYHRIVRYRKFLDEILGGDSRFWGVHRTPPFAANMLSFQTTDSTGLSALRPR